MPKIKLDTSDFQIACINPFRYRGYCYDQEIGLYYLQSRYYDCNVGRFVNADDLLMTLLSGNIIYQNALAYCCNDATNTIDYLGYMGAEAAALKFVVTYGLGYAGVSWGALKTLYKYRKKELNRVEFVYADKYLDRHIDLILSQYTEHAIDSLMSGELYEYPQPFITEPLEIALDELTC